MVTPIQRIPALLGGGYFKPPVYQQPTKKIVQQKVPALLRKDYPVYTKTSE
jgi:hypothetical protein